MNKKVMRLILAFIMILSYCLVTVTSVAAADTGNVNQPEYGSCQFEGYRWYLSDTNYGIFKGNIEMLDNDTVKGSADLSYIVTFDASNMIYGYFTAGWRHHKVVEAAKVDVDGQPAVWTLMKITACGTVYCNEYTIDDQYCLALIVDGCKPGSEGDCILGVGCVIGEKEAKSVYDNYLVTKDASGLSSMSVKDCSVVIE